MSAFAPLVGTKRTSISAAICEYTLERKPRACRGFSKF
jgi:hypothetical protein